MVKSCITNPEWTEEDFKKAVRWKDVVEENKKQIRDTNTKATKEIQKD